MAVSTPHFDFISRLHQAQAQDPALVAIHNEVHAGTLATPWAVTDDMVTFDGRLYIPPATPLLLEIIMVVHNDGHEGVHCMLHRLQRDFHFPNMRRVVQDFCARAPPASGTNLSTRTWHICTPPNPWPRCSSLTSSASMEYHGPLSPTGTRCSRRRSGARSCALWGPRCTSPRCSTRSLMARRRQPTASS